MKIEKVEIEHLIFKPIRITLVIESIDDLKELYFRYICDSDISPKHEAHNQNENKFNFDNTPNDFSTKLSELYNDLTK
jgi:hypothetical protein